MNKLIRLDDNIRVLNMLNGLNHEDFYRVLYSEGGFNCALVGKIKEIKYSLNGEIKLVMTKVDTTGSFEEKELEGVKVRTIIKLSDFRPEFTESDDSESIIYKGCSELEESFDMCYSELETLVTNLYDNLLGSEVHLYLSNGESFNAKVLTVDLQGIDFKYSYNDIYYMQTPVLKYNIVVTTNNGKSVSTYSSLEIVKIVAED